MHLVNKDTFILAKDFLVDIADVDSTKSLNVFISHRWIRGWDGAPGYDKRAHTDDEHNNKYKLIIEGVEKFWKATAPGMTQCHVWLDFSCINQDGDPAGELRDLDKIVGWGDAMFTPIVDLEDGTWDLPAEGFTSMLIAYKAKEFSGVPNGYLNRAWCRIEMMDSALVPLRADSVVVERLKCFKAGLLHALNNGRRFHVLYGTRESRRNAEPLALPPLLYSNFDEFNPEKGTITNEADRVKIRELVKDLEQYKKEVVYGYVGEYDANGIFIFIV
jgi:hypothetical protein